MSDKHSLGTADIRWFSGFLVILAALLGGWTIAQPPAFNLENAKHLKLDKRHEYDVIFANEMAIWPSNSNRYINEYLAPHPKEKTKQTDQPYRHRHEEFSAMAADGYLPAYVALRLFDIRQGKRLEDAEALRMLMDAAAEGDVSAMCGMNALPFVTTQFDRVPEFPIAQDQALAKGAALNHGGCLAKRGAKAAWRFGIMPDGKTPISFLADIDSALPDLFESARQGYYKAYWTLYQIRRKQLKEKNYQLSGTLDLERTLCWGRLAQQHANETYFDSGIRELTGYLARGLPKDQVEQFPRGLWPKVSPEYLPLIDRYSPFKVPITRTVATVERCIEIENQFATYEK